MKYKLDDYKICLVYPDIMRFPRAFNKLKGTVSQESKLLPPLGLAYIAANSNANIDIFDNRIHRLSNVQLWKRLKTKGYNIVGFSGTIFEAPQAVSVSRMLMESGVTTIYGGPNATANFHLYLKDFNVILRGELELMFDKIIQQPAKYLQCVYAGKHMLLYNTQIFRVNDLDSLQFPDRAKLELNKYDRKEGKQYIGTEPIDTVVSSRGCPFDCMFCASKNIWQRNWNARSPENVFEEINTLVQQYGTKGVYFREDNFTVDKQRVRNLSSLLSNTDIKWLCEARADSISDELVRSMKKGGCKGIWFGVESLIPFTLSKIRKGITVKQIEKAAKICKKHGLTTGACFILGFPWETIAQMKYTIERAKNIGFDRLSFNRLFVFPGSDIYDYVIRENLNTSAFENIILPSTHYSTSETITKLAYETAVPLLHRTVQKLPQPIVNIISKVKNAI